MKRGLTALLLALVTALILLPTTALATDVQAQEAADALHALGLFQGTGSDENGQPVYDLDRTPSRLEALTMLVRVLGKEQDVRTGAWSHPFSDVDAWAAPYVGYAYRNGLTKGVSDTLFGNEATDAAQYLTFVLRALGYSDAGGQDFTWDSPFALAAQVGILPGGVDLNDFKRSDIALISHAALQARLKDSDLTLAQKLIVLGAFTQEEYSAQASIPSADPILTSTQISQKCSPAVFYIESYHVNGTPKGSGSGFLISDQGLAVTNYHVVADAYNIIAKLTDGTVCHASVIDGNSEDDLALLRLEGEGFPYLTLDSSSFLQQGQTIYTIGSPEGLDNTMSNGIISNADRILDGVNYIQISAPIASGSSGGALLNEAGKVIGITCGRYGSSGDLNLAVPAGKVWKLDFTSQEDLILFSRERYAGFDDTPDFGVCSGARLLNTTPTTLGYTCEYDMADFYSLFDLDNVTRYSYALSYYEELLEDCGFSLFRQKGFYITIYRTVNESVTIRLDYSTQKIVITVEYALQYYPDAPSLPDLGWYLGLGYAEPTVLDSSYMWAYRWSDYYTRDEFTSAFDTYLDLLEENDFTFIGSVDENYLYEGEGYSVFLSVKDWNVYIDAEEL